MSATALLCLVPVLALAAAVLLFNVRRTRLRRLATRLPASVCDAVLARIDEAGSADGTRRILVRPQRSLEDGHAQSARDERVIGILWPLVHRSGQPQMLAELLLQVPPLPQVWEGRRITLSFDETDVVIAGSDTSPLSATGQGTSSTEPVRLMGLRLPNAISDEQGAPPYDPHLLCRRLPEVRALLAPYTSEPERLLPFILVPGIATYELDTYLVSLMGGEPELIQNEHDSPCAHCGRPMRFLLSVGDVLGLAGDAPVVYVYGCDSHPGQVRAFVDMH